MRRFKIILFPDPEKKVVAFEVQADTVDVDPRGNAVFKTAGATVGVVSNAAYQVVKEIVTTEKTIVKK